MAEDTRPDKKQDTWSADSYQKTASFVYSNKFTAPVLTLLDAIPGEKIIDVGCGSGEVTLQIKQLVGETGVVVGMDSSESMVRTRFSSPSAQSPNSQRTPTHDIRLRNAKSLDSNTHLWATHRPLASPRPGTRP